MFSPAAINIVIDGTGGDPFALRRLHPDPATPAHYLAAAILDATQRLSRIEQQLGQQVEAAAEVLGRIRHSLATGTACDSFGELQQIATNIELLAASHADAHDALTIAVRAYREAVQPQDAAAGAPASH